MVLYLIVLLREVSTAKEKVLLNHFFIFIRADCASEVVVSHFFVPSPRLTLFSNSC